MVRLAHATNSELVDRVRISGGNRSQLDSTRMAWRQAIARRGGPGAWPLASAGPFAGTGSGRLEVDGSNRRVDGLAPDVTRSDRELRGNCYDRNNPSGPYQKSEKNLD